MGSATCTFIPNPIDSVKMTSDSELACVYASLILADEDIPITGEKIATIVKAANVAVEPFWPGLFAKALENCDVKSLISSVGSGPAAGGAAPAGGDAPAAAEEKKEEKKEEEEEESDDDMGFGLFD